MIPVIELSGIGVTLVPIVMALTSLVKVGFPSLEGRWSPMVALAIGMALSFLVDGAVFMDSTVLGGIVVGLMASGLYSGAKATLAPSRAEEI